MRGEKRRREGRRCRGGEDDMEEMRRNAFSARTGLKTKSLDEHGNSSVAMFTVIIK